MTINSTKTINFVKLSILRDANLPFTVANYSTLNQKFSVGNQNPPSSGYPTIQYLAIGRGGATYTGTGNNTLMTQLLHGPADAALFQHIPFVLVPVAADLSPTAQLAYRLKVPVTISSVNYYAYYLKVFSLSNITPQTNIITLANGVVQSSVTWAPSSANLNPTPVDVSNTQINITNGAHIVPSLTLPISLNSTDIAGIVNACTVMFGSAQYANLSEIGIVAGFDFQNTDSNGVTYTEVQAAQIMDFIAVQLDLQQMPSSISIPVSLSEALPYPAILN